MYTYKRRIIKKPFIEKREKTFTSSHSPFSARSLIRKKQTNRKKACVIIINLNDSSTFWIFLLVSMKKQQIQFIRLSIFLYLRFMNTRECLQRYYKVEKLHLRISKKALFYFKLIDNK